VTYVITQKSRGMQITKASGCGSCMKPLAFLGSQFEAVPGSQEFQGPRVPSPAVSRNFVASHELTEVVEVPTVTLNFWWSCETHFVGGALWTKTAGP
jgi:hypothetical protein